MMLSSLNARSPESARTPLEEDREKMFIHSTERGMRECFPKCEAIREPKERQRQSHSLHVLSPLFTFLESAAVRSAISYRCGALAL